MLGIFGGPKEEPSIGLLGRVSNHINEGLNSPLADLSIGLLQASAPSTTPQSLGGNLAQAAGYASQRQAQRGRNQLIRDRLEQEQQQRRAQAMLQQKLSDPNSGLLPEGLDPETFAAMNAANPEIAGMILQRKFFPEGGRVPNDIAMLDALGLPRTPEGLAQLSRIKGQNGTDALKTLALQTQILRDQQDMRLKGLEFEENRAESTQKKASAVSGIKSLAKDLLQVGKHSNRLSEIGPMFQGTDLLQGPAESARAVVAEAKEALAPGQQNAQREVIQLQDAINSVGSRVALIAAKSFGSQQTNQLLRLIQESKFSSADSDQERADKIANVAMETLAIIRTMKENGIEDLDDVDTGALEGLIVDQLNRARNIPEANEGPDQFEQFLLQGVEPEDIQDKGLAGQYDKWLDQQLGLE